jgi:hypothetical protein
MHTTSRCACRFAVVLVSKQMFDLEFPAPDAGGPAAAGVEPALLVPR